MEKARILQFDEHRRLFHENANSLSKGDLLLQALGVADFTKNHHFHYWLVRRYPGRLRVQRGERL
jgi:hypothetical protein